MIDGLILIHILMNYCILTHQLKAEVHVPLKTLSRVSDTKIKKCSDIF